MLTGKQRSYLKSLAHSKKPLTQIGKEGINDGFIEQMNILLEQHELVKINVLDNSGEAAQDVANELCEALNAEFVQAIGHKFTIYRQSRENPMIMIPGADNTRALKNIQSKAQASKKDDRTNKAGGKISKPLKGKRGRAKTKALAAKKTERMVSIKKKA